MENKADKPILIMTIPNSWIVIYSESDRKTTYFDLHKKFIVVEQNLLFSFIATYFNFGFSKLKSN